MHLSHDNYMDTSVRKGSPYGALAPTPPPDYDLEHDTADLKNLTPESSRSAESLPPAYEEGNGMGPSTSPDQFPKARSVAAFRHTKALQVESVGHPWFSLPLPPKPVPIPVYAVQHETNLVGEMVYQSLRQKRRSGDCTLVRAGDPSEEALVTTNYRFGCGRAPCMQIGDGEQFEIVNRGFATRATVFRTQLGTFEWRYANRQERKAMGAHSLILFERVTKVALDEKRDDEQRTIVAMFVRNKEVRTAGTGDSTAGNGGRLLLDMRALMDSKGLDEQFEQLVVSSCICMMKREVDRRRVHQAIMIAGASGGGGG
ncbi:hypothetical protein K4F52_001673 [Lecanicillium sp. MT-2017a]|nr:hypothetical protein K4F52_001673 [Lecanicillium sp. MT-2017a]